jgi:hypothetical protein
MSDSNIPVYISPLGAPNLVSRYELSTVLGKLYDVLLT